MFQRKILDKMRAWKNEENGRTALLVEGPRRVGKSTVVKAFAQQEYESFVLIDFSSCSQEIRDLFQDMSDMDYFFLQLQLLTGVRLIKGKSLIVFDEVQLFPAARQAVKHLVADRRYAYIETGSLISIRKNVKDILIPSEERRIRMYPMDFEEFLWAIGDNVTMALLRQLYQGNKPAGDGAHRRIMRTLRLYMLVGGMPQAVDAYLQANNFAVVDRVKRDILQLYEDDFYKIDETGRLSRLFDAIPTQLHKNDARYKVSSVISHLRPGNSMELISELIDSRTVLAAYHTSNPSAEMASYLDLTRFKLFLSDTGLFTALMFKNKAFTENDIYQKLLSDKHSANLGYLYENLVAQMLAAREYELFYHTFSDREKTASYEVDFLISRKQKMCPIEIKSSGYKRHASFDAFCRRYSAQIGDKYILYTKDVQKERDIMFLPVYMTPLL